MSGLVGDGEKYAVLLWLLGFEAGESGRCDVI